MSVNTKVNGQLVKSAGLYTVSTPIGMADIYSTEEKEVGLWIDNKPLYEKTIHFGTLPNRTTKEVAHGIENVDSQSFVSIEGIANVSSYAISMPKVHDGNNNALSQCFFEVSSTTIKCYARTQDLSSLDCYIILKYTKTTDTPWSGKFVPQGYGYVSSGDIYSFEERQVGVWANGKPLYQKTIDCGALPANTTKNVAHGITDIDRIVSVSGCAFRSASGNETGIPIPSTHYQTIGNQNEVSVNFTNVVLRNGNSSASAFDKTQVTIQYTKTTDVAGSGEYVPSGDKAVHYSTEEEVIGTFLGETLYRKTINFGALPNNDTKLVAHGISNLKYIKSYEGTAKSTTNGYYLPLPYLHSSNASYYVEIFFTGTNVALVTKADRSAYDECYITLEYTKTS